MTQLGTRETSVRPEPKKPEPVEPEERLDLEGLPAHLEPTELKEEIDRANTLVPGFDMSLSLAAFRGKTVPPGTVTPVDFIANLSVDRHR